MSCIPQKYQPLIAVELQSCNLTAQTSCCNASRATMAVRAMSAKCGALRDPTKRDAASAPWQH
jgi:hypothetical protein